MILSPDTPESEDLANQNFLDLYQSAMDLYGLIHARFILTAKGLQMMKEKFIKNVFGACPRMLCDRQLVLPIGMSEELSISRVKVFCPKCKEVYIPRMRFVDVDGAYFGSSFPHIFLQTFPELKPKEKAIQYVPKIYGFKLFGKKGSKYEGQPNLIFDINNSTNVSSNISNVLLKK
jgi:casein kinase II subunit beta